MHHVLLAEERGRWWIVGSAWTGHLPGENPSQGKTLLPIDSSKPGKSSDMAYSLQLLELARKQRMNTGVRKDIFCILMTSEVFKICTKLSNISEYKSELLSLDWFL